jgi:hypothetical protein
MMYFQQKKMKRFTLFLLSATLYTAACNDAAKSPGSGNTGKGNMAGGGCSYKNDTAIAEVVKIDKRDTDRYDILFVLRSAIFLPAGRDTLHYATEKHSMITGDELKTMGIKVGDHYKYIVSTIISGSCNPTVTQLVMEKVK